jgi:proline racemase
MHTNKVITVVDAHAEGALGKVITGGVLGIPGKTMLDKARHLELKADGLRRFLLTEPRGSVTTMANLILAPTRPDADAGLIIMESMGYPAMSGSNTICAVTVLLETGMIPIREPITRLALDTPGGLVNVVAECRSGRCESVKFLNVPAFVSHLDATVEVPGLPSLKLDIAYGGVFFAIVDAQALGFSIAPDEARDLVALGTRIVTAAADQLRVRHPKHPNIMANLFAQFAGPIHNRKARHISKNTVVVPPGWLDRCPTGTGTSARLALMHARRQIHRGEILEHQSILGSRFLGEVIGASRVGALPAVRTAIRGRAWISGMQHYLYDPDDPFPTGFTLSDVWP